MKFIWSFVRWCDMQETCHPRLGGQPAKWAGGLRNIALPDKKLSDEFHRLLDERMHVAVILDERNDLAVACEDLLDSP